MVDLLQKYIVAGLNVSWKVTPPQKKKKKALQKDERTIRFFFFL